MNQFQGDKLQRIEEIIKEDVNPNDPSLNATLSVLTTSNTEHQVPKSVICTNCSKAMWMVRNNTLINFCRIQQEQVYRSDEPESIPLCSGILLE